MQFEWVRREGLAWNLKAARLKLKLWDRANWLRTNKPPPQVTKSTSKQTLATDNRWFGWTPYFERTKKVTASKNGKRPLNSEEWFRRGHGWCRKIKTCNRKGA